MDYDNLRYCKNCADRLTTNPSGICSNCREQEMIDDAVPDAPINYFADDEFWGNDEDEDGWTDDEEEELLSYGFCPECGAELDICGHGDPALDRHWGDEYDE